MRKEISFAYSTEDLVKRLTLPKNSVIISMYTSVVNAGARQFCFKISVPEKDLDKYAKKLTKSRRKKNAK